MKSAAAVALETTKKKKTRPRRALFKAWRRHPLTQRLIQISAPTETALAAYLHHIETIRTEYRLKLRSRSSVARDFCRLQYGEVTLARAVALYIAQPTLAPKTKERTARFLKLLEPEMQSKQLDELDIGVVSAWLDRLALPPRCLIASSRELEWHTLSGIVHHAIERGWIAEVPWGTSKPKFRDRRPPRGREALRSLAELARLLEAARELDAEADARSQIWRVPSALEAKIATATAAGLRIGELCGLRWSDFDEVACTLTIERQGGEGAPTKTKRRYVIAVAPELFEVLGVHRDRLKKARIYHAKGLVFPNPRTTTIGKARAYAAREVIDLRGLRKAVRRAGLPTPERWSPHSLKDSFATLEQLTYGSDLRALRERTRHASLKSLLQYLHSLSRAPAAPGFRLPPRGATLPSQQLSLLLPAAQTTTAPTEADAVEGAGKARLA